MNFIILMVWGVHATFSPVSAGFMENDVRITFLLKINFIFLMVLIYS